MLHDLPVRIQAEDVDPCPVTITRPVLIAMQDHHVTLCQHAAKLHTLAGILSSHSLEVVDEGVLAVRNHRIVLDVGATHVTPHGLRRFTLVEHQVVERSDCALVGVQIHYQYSLDSAVSVVSPPTSPF